ncbi:membrane protein [Microbacterium sorbitolivorans]|uniref:Low temperature requirement protein A n=1 Tax=Microbacterium sorbitolivorans TaxID=1867410 RepID=A0A367Y7Q0_9MICO|nr:low temperature requirement protein A [Microbacterium sorbitolivorans]RCK61884.1 low temperature requirement protein A [Microbacterium sorbitolivorans]GGF44880.1 membrane protein [Microbacterium sorbitolivorans]
MTTVPLARPGHRRSEVGPVELFFDLVYVFAIVQLSHLLIGHLAWTGAAQTVVVFAAVWWGWNYTAWAMNWLDPSRTAVQLFSGVLMLAALGMAIAIPGAFGDGAWLFVGCYLFMGVLRPVFMMIAHRGQQLASNYRMLMLWTLFAGIFWVIGAILPAEWRLLAWLVAVLIDYAAPLADYRIPGIGAAPMTTWDTDAEHLAERNRLVFIIALGESVLLMGGSVVEHGHLTGGLALSVLVGFASLFVLWWNYFALAGPETAGGNASTGALRSAYAYAHALMVLGAILVAVSIELRLSHEHLDPAIVLVTIAGPIVYLIGNVLFLRSRFGQLGRSRFIAMGVIVVIGAIALLLRDYLPVILLSLSVLTVTAVLAAQTARIRRDSTPSGRRRSQG